MKPRYIAWQGKTPRCNLPGSPFPSKRQVQTAAKKAGISEPKITAVRRQSPAN